MGRVLAQGFGSGCVRRPLCLALLFLPPAASFSFLLWLSFAGLVERSCRRYAQVRPAVVGHLPLHDSQPMPSDLGFQILATWVLPHTRGCCSLLPRLASHPKPTSLRRLSAATMHRRSWVITGATLSLSLSLCIEFRQGIRVLRFGC